VNRPQITVFCGRFGSGKTEVSLNYALRLAERGARPLLVDLDLVTPYFRTRDRSEEMAERGVETVAPFEIGRHIHVPAVNPAILGAIEQVERPVVIDVGGDEQGARALGQYAPTLRRRGYRMYLVVNPYRPATGSLDGIKAAVQQVEASSQLRVSALVSNPHLMAESTPELLIDGHQLIEEAGRTIDLSIAFLVVSEDLLHALHQVETGLDLERSPWELAEHQGPATLVIRRFFAMFDL
jgi:hypothetical protein